MCLREHLYVVRVERVVYVGLCVFVYQCDACINSYVCICVHVFVSLCVSMSLMWQCACCIHDLQTLVFYRSNLSNLHQLPEMKANQVTLQTCIENNNGYCVYASSRFTSH